MHACFARAGCAFPRVHVDRLRAVARVPRRWRRDGHRGMPIYASALVTSGLHPQSLPPHAACAGCYIGRALGWRRVDADATQPRAARGESAAAVGGRSSRGMVMLGEISHTHACMEISLSWRAQPNRDLVL
jgi:hypothetical protein